jgi:TonB family protein
LSDANGEEESSVVEYSLAELGFILVFVLLLLSGWEVNSFNEEKRKTDIEAAKLEKDLEAANVENAAMKKSIQDITPEGVVWGSDTILVDKANYLILTEELERFKSAELESPSELDPEVLRRFKEIAAAHDPLPEDFTVVSEKYLAELMTPLEETEPPDTSTSSEIDPGLLAGDRGFCTYGLPDAGSVEVYGKTVSIGTVLIEEDGLTLLSRNTNLQNRDLVDIAGEAYDTQLVTVAINDWPLNEKLSPAAFLLRGARFVDIGDIPSNMRKECRFGMDFYRPEYSKKSYNNLKNVFENIFLKGWELQEADYLRLYPVSYSPKIGGDNVGSSPNLNEERLNEVMQVLEGDLNGTQSSETTLKPQESLRTPPEVKKKVSPDYPRVAQQRGIAGSVQLTYKVSVYGGVIDISIEEENPVDRGFGLAAERALQGWIFTPASRNGFPVKSELQTQTFTFK